MLTQRFDIAGADRARTFDAFRSRLLPPLTVRRGVAGAHLLLADDAISKIETVEKMTRADATLVPTWIVLIEGSSAADVRSAGDVLAAELRDLLGDAAPTPATAVYQLEHSRCKTPWSAG